MNTIGKRLGRLAVVWPPSCPTCRDRPVMVSVAVGEADPVFPVRCPQCGRRLPPVVVVAGVDVEAI